jgi:hypothetical protein
LLTVAVAETVEQSYRCICIGPDHFSLAFTDAPLAAMKDSGFRAWMAYMKWLKARGSPWM